MKWNIFFFKVLTNGENNKNNIKCVLKRKYNLFNKKNLKPKLGE